MSATVCVAEKATAVMETDWLGSRPVFYNERTARVSHNINDVIDFANLEFHPEGLRNYLGFGYSVFGQTPVRDVKFLPPATQLRLQPDGRLTLLPLDDPVDDWLGRISHEGDVLARLEHVVREWEQQVEGEIIIPTSGGYDSRLLNLLVRDKQRIRAFTFGLSNRQAESHEVVYARALAQRLGLRWQHIPLGRFHQYFDEWNTLFGVSTHAHGMYQLEFYHRIAELQPPPLPLLSGIIGDAWAGAVEVGPVDTPTDVLKLGWTHGMHADETMCVLKGDEQLAQEYFERRRARLRDPRFRVVEAMRFKMLLLTYLLRVPAHVGFRPWSPFLRPDIALAMLTLPDERRTQRRWQRELFVRHGLAIEAQPLAVDRRNTLNQQALRRQPPLPLDETLLREVIRPDYVRWINALLARAGPLWDAFWGLVVHRRFGRPLRQRGLRDRRMEAYCAYLTLRPIENVLRRRDRGGVI